MVTRWRGQEAAAATTASETAKRSATHESNKEVKKQSENGNFRSPLEFRIHKL
jgi:hypothetical protein